VSPFLALLNVIVVYLYRFLKRQFAVFSCRIVQKMSLFGKKLHKMTFADIEKSV